MFTASRLLARTTYRSITTKSIIPPNLASSAAKPSNASSQSSNIEDLVYIYRQLPKGPAPKATQGKGPYEWYRARYFGENASAAPVVHLVGFLFVFGYYIEYVGHLSHHKNVKHH